IARGDLAGGLKWLEQGEPLFVRGAVPDVRPIDAVKVRVWIMQGRLDEASEWASNRGLTCNDELSYFEEFRHITLVRLLIARFQKTRDEQAIVQAANLLIRLMESAEASGRFGAVIELLVLQAIVMHERGDSPGGLASLGRA